MTGKNQKAIGKYLDEVVVSITPGTLKDDVARELQCHLRESIEEARQFGLDEDAATQTAIDRMGDPSALGRRLAEIHRPRLNGWLIAFTGVLLLLGWVAMFSLGRLGGHFLYGLGGLFLGGLLIFSSYSRLKRLALPLYVATFGLVGLAVLLGPTYEGQPYLFLGPLRIKLMDACPFLFVVSLAAMMAREKWERRRDALLLIAAAGLVEVLFFSTHSLPGLILFVTAMMTVMHFSSAKFWQISLVGLGGVVPLVLFHDPAALVSPETFSLALAQESHTDFVLAHLMRSLGRPVAMLAVGAALLMLIQLADAVRGIKAETPRLVSLGLTTLIGSEFVWSTLANLGWAPMPRIGLNFPFLSFGGTLLVVHLASVGMVLGAYRRRTLATV